MLPGEDALRPTLKELTAGEDKLFLQGRTGWRVCQAPLPYLASRILSDSATCSKGPSLEKRPPGADGWSDRIGSLPSTLSGDNQAPSSSHPHTGSFLAPDSQYDR